jgi:hypothetical protein
MKLAFLERRRARARYEAALEPLGAALGQGRHDEAVGLAERALADAELAFGPRHHEVLLATYVLASARLAAGELERAREAGRRALELEGELPPGARQELPSRAQLVELLASVAERALDHEGLAQRLDELVGLYEAEGQGGEPLGATLLRAALARVALGERGAAEVALRRAEGLVGLSASTRAKVLHALATHRAPELELAPVEAWFREALELAPPSERALRAAILQNWGAALADHGEARAAEVLVRALDAVSEAHGPDDPRARPTLVRLARIEQAAGRAVSAMALFARALELTERELGREHEIARALRSYLDGASA